MLLPALIRLTRSKKESSERIKIEMSITHQGATGYVWRRSASAGFLRICMCQIEEAAAAMETATRILMLWFQPRPPRLLEQVVFSGPQFNTSSLLLWFCSGSGLAPVDFGSVVKNLTRCDLMSCRLQLIDDLSYEDVKKCYRGSVSHTHTQTPLFLCRCEDVYRLNVFLSP